MPKLCLLAAQLCSLVFCCLLRCEFISQGMDGADERVASCRAESPLIHILSVGPRAVIKVHYSKNPTENPKPQAKGREKQQVLISRACLGPSS